MRDVTSRLLNNLLGRGEELDLRKLTEPCIIISHDLSPSRTALLDRRMVLGFATDVGSKTSHTAIMARSLRIPAVVGLQQASRELSSGEPGRSIAVEVPFQDHFVKLRAERLDGLLRAGGFAAREQPADECAKSERNQSDYDSHGIHEPASLRNR